MTKKRDAAKLHQAIIFATKAHKGQVRKGTDIDYICHPMEVMQILASMNADVNLQIAGVLHDVVEDTPITIEEIEELFGSDVATLVNFHTEDKSLSWRKRKEAAIDAIEFADKRQQMLIMADKISNQRSLAADYFEIGDAVWERFNASKEEICWYYSAVQDALKEMGNYEETDDFYWELILTFKEIFVSYFTDAEMTQIYQMADAGHYILLQNAPEWKDYEGQLPEDAVAIPREKAEKMEAEWLTHYLLRAAATDMDDGLYEIYCGGSGDNIRTLKVYISGRKIQLNVEDSAIYIDETGHEHPSRFYYELDHKESAIFAKMLRSQYGATGSFEEILKDAFGSHDGPIKFKVFCEALNLGYTYCANRPPRKGVTKNE